MRCFVVEDRSDVSVYRTLESAVRAVEPADVPRMKLFDELGREYVLSIESKKVRFLKFWPTTVESTVLHGASHDAALELEQILRDFSIRSGIPVPSDARLPELAQVAGSFLNDNRKNDREQ